MRLVPCTLFLAAVGAACTEPDPYVCQVDSDCTLDGVPGRCTAEGTCAAAEPPLAAGRHCLAGPALPVTDACAAMVCETRPWCCGDGWTENCVHAAETACGMQCSGLLAANGYMMGGVGAFDGATYTPRWSGNVVGWAYQSAWGDIDGDGRGDLAVGLEVRGPGDRGLLVAPWNPDGPPLLGEALAIGGDGVLTSTSTLQWVDYGNDGRLDLLAAGDQGLHLVIQDDTGAFTAHRISPSRIDSVAWIDDDGVAPWRIAVGYGYVDNPDPDPDQPEHTMIHVIDGSPPVMDAGELLAENLYIGDLTYCQVTGGPARDLVIGTYPVRVAMATADGFEAPSPLSVGGYRAECADMNGDGIDDLLISGGNSDPVDLFLNLDNIGIGEPETIAGNIVTDGMDVGDVDGDGDLDIVTQEFQGSTQPLKYIRNDTPPGGAPEFTQSVAVDWNADQLDGRDVDLGPVPRPPD
jgi:hypothetical protein